MNKRLTRSNVKVEMKTFRVPVWEQIKVWNEVLITVEAESIDKLFEAIQQGEFATKYEWLDIHTVQRIPETEEAIDYDYSDVRLEDIKEEI